MSPSPTLLFDPAQPFPLFDEAAHGYAAEQAHSTHVDRWLGLRTEACEEALRQDSRKNWSELSTPPQLWIGLPAQSLCTPYTEFRRMLAYLDPPPGTRVVDLGAGYGRLGFVLHRHFPEVKFLGYELAGRRVTEARRCLGVWQGGEPEIVEQDLAAPDFVPAPASYYFLYDFGSRRAIDKILVDLRTIARDHGRLTVIGRGRSSRDAIEHEHPWLSRVVAPAHFRNFSVYRSA